MWDLVRLSPGVSETIEMWGGGAVGQGEGARGHCWWEWREVAINSNQVSISVVGAICSQLAGCVFWRVWLNGDGIVPECCGFFGVCSIVLGKKE